MTKYLVLILIFVSVNIQSQNLQQGQTLNKIVAIVGNEVIMLSDIDGQIAYMAMRDPKINPEDKKMRAEILSGLVDQLLISTKAIEDSIVVSDDEITQRLDLHLQGEIQRLGSDKRLEQVYGMTMARVRNELREQIKQNLLSQTLIQKKFSELKITPREVEDFYAKYKDSLETVPPSLELYHIVKNVEANGKDKTSIFENARKIRDSIIAGGDFKQFAKKYSDDKATSDDGGELGWFDRGKLFPEFEKAAFNLATGETSLPIETPFGYHIIQTLEKKADAIRTRHILLKLGQSSEDIERAKQFLRELAQKVSSGSKFEDLAKQFSDEKESKGFGGSLGIVPIAEIPDAFKEIVDKLKDGEVSEPVLYNTDKLKPSYHIIYKKRSVPESRPTLLTHFKEIELRATDFKKRDLYQKWIAELRKEIYWEIKE